MTYPRLSSCSIEQQEPDMFAVVTQMQDENKMVNPAPGMAVTVETKTG